MSTLTLRRGEADTALEAGGARLNAFFRRLTAGREARARRTVATYLASCTDERLRDLGLSERDIAAIRAGTFRGVCA